MSGAGWKRRLVVVMVGVVVGFGGLAGQPAGAGGGGGDRERRCGDCYGDRPSGECGRSASCGECDQGRGCGDCYPDRPCGGRDRPPPCRSCDDDRSCGERSDRPPCDGRDRPSPCRDCYDDGPSATMTGRGTATTTPIGSPAGSATGSRPPAAARRRPGGTVVTTRRAAMTTSPAAATGATPANARTGAASTSAATATATATTRVRASIGSFAESSIDRGVSGECLRLPRAAIRSVAEKRPRTAPAVLTHAQSGDYPHFPRVRPLRRGSNDVRGNARGMDGYPSGSFAPELRSERQPGECGADHDHDGARQAAPGAGPPVRRRGRGGESGRLQGRPGRGL